MTSPGLCHCESANETPCGLKSVEDPLSHSYLFSAIDDSSVLLGTLIYHASVFALYSGCVVTDRVVDGEVHVDCTSVSSEEWSTFGPCVNSWAKCTPLLVDPVIESNVYYGSVPLAELTSC